MTEPDVTLTDYVLALAGVLFVILLSRRPGRSAALRFWFVFFFASVSAASFCGGTTHGFFHDEPSPGNAILWRLTLLAMGATALSTWAIAANLLSSKQFRKRLLAAACGELAFYSVAVIFLTQGFWLGLADTLPAFLFLILVLGLAYRREKRGYLLVAGGGPALTVTAGLLQQMGVGIHPLYFNHNALYHVLDLIALWLFFLGGRRLIAAENDRTEMNGANIEPGAFKNATN